MEEFSEWFRNELNKRDWSQADMARISDMKSSHISRLINGDRNPGKKTCRQIARAFKIPQQEVFIHAGQIDPPHNYDPEINRIIHKISELKPEYRIEVEDLIDVKLKRQKQPVPMDGRVKVRTGKTPVLNG